MDGDVHKSEIIGTVEKYKTKAAAEKAVAKKREEINELRAGYKVSALCKRFLEEGMKDVRPRCQTTYKSFLKRVRMEFDGWLVSDMIREVTTVEDWINDYQRLPVPEKIKPAYMAKGKLVPAVVTPGKPARDVSKKTKLHLKAFIHLLYKYAMKWQMAPFTENPAKLIDVRGRKKAVRIHTYLTGEQYQSIIADPDLPQHVRVMIQVAMLLGLRISEILGLSWEQIDFDEGTITVKTSVVGKDVDDTKTEESEAVLPMHEDLAVVLSAWKAECEADEGDYEIVEGWVFGNLITERPYWGGTMQQDHLIPAGAKLGIKSLGWHDFRHTYRAMMGEEEIPLEMQKTLMRHTDIRTTLGYGGRRSLAKARAANARVVEMARKRA
jgi:integrase